LGLAEAKLLELEKKVDVAMKGLNVLLFGEGEDLPEDEIRDLKERLNDYVVGRCYWARECKISRCGLSCCEC
jgi:hypothetical protein